MSAEPVSPAAAPVLEVRGIAKQFFGVQVLHGVHFAIRAGQALGLVGENGSGKSTSMNILGGVLQPDGGDMLLDGQPYRPATPRDAAQAGIAFIHQELNLFPNLSIEENVFIDRFPRRSVLPFIDRKAIRSATDELLRQVDLHLPPGTQVARLSQGERQLVEIAKALSANPKVIILDEPTTSLTRREVDRLFAIMERLKKRGIGMVYISHALDDVFEVCEHVTVLRDGAVVGDAPAAELSMPKVIGMMVGRSIDAIFPARTLAPRERTMLEVRGLSQPGVAENVSFAIRAGEVVGLAGLMGSGRSELARMIFGLDPFARGDVIVDGRPIAEPGPAACMEAGIAFLTEDRRHEGLLMDSSIAENTILASLADFSGPAGLVDGGKVADAATSMARKVHLSTDRVTETKAKHLSGGNQQKVVIGKWLMRKPKVFILDEPTRGIDVGAKQEVYKIVNALVEDGSAVLLISSEIEELIGLSDRILTISRGEITGGFERSRFDREAIMAAATRTSLAAQEAAR
jgi:ABC-type sugar transport system ATPase subunit